MDAKPAAEKAQEPPAVFKDNGLSKLFLTIAVAFAEAERDHIRERISKVKADQKARGRFLGGSVQFGYRLWAITESWCRTSPSRRQSGR